MPSTSQGHAYRPRCPQDTVLHHIVDEHLEDFLEQVEASGRPLPGFVRRELQEFLRCGDYTRGFVRWLCPGCKTPRLVALACRSRGVCPSCTARRMADTAAHLVTAVIPRVPIRQWTLSLPFPIHARVGYDAALCADLMTIAVRSIFAWLRRAAREDGVLDGRPGAILFVQRHTSGLRLAPHAHILVPDGVYHRQSPDGPVRFHRTRAPSDRDVLSIVARIAHQAAQRLTREPPEPEEEALLVECAHAPATRQRRLRMTRSAPAWSKRCAEVDGFNLHADVLIPARDRSALERLCRYVIRPAAPESRLDITEDGAVRLELKKVASDGATHVLFDPVAFLARIATLIPPPKVHQTRYFGIFAPNCAWRRHVVPVPPTHRASPRRPPRHGRYAWRDLLLRVMAVDGALCPSCGLTMRRVAVVLKPSAVHAILAAIGVPDDPDRMTRLHPARGPPSHDIRVLPWVDD